MSGPVQVAAQTLHSSSADKLHNLGETVFSNDGRAFRYAQANGTTALVAGTLQQSRPETTSHQDLTAVAAAIGDAAIVSTSTITTSANEYAEGWALITVTPGIGRQYKIKGHAAFAAAAPTFNLFDTIAVALTTDSRIDVVRNPYSRVVINPTTATAAPIGVAVHPLAVSEFGWLQVGGVASILADGALLVGQEVIASNGTAGAVEPQGAGPGSGTQSCIGFAMTGVATTENGAVKLQGIL